MILYTFVFNIFFRMKSLSSIIVNRVHFYCIINIAKIYFINFSSMQESVHQHYNINGICNL